MLIIRDGTGVTIKSGLHSTNHVRIGVLRTAIYVDGDQRVIRKNTKPHGQYTNDDCADLLAELKRTEGWAEHADPIDPMLEDDYAGPECPGCGNPGSLCDDCEYLEGVDVSLDANDDPNEWYDSTLDDREEENEADD